MVLDLKRIILTSLLAVSSSAGGANVFTEQENLFANISQFQTYIFVSFSMPDSALKSYYIEAEQAGARLVMRGLKNNSFLETKAKADEIGISFDIDPNLFEEYQITSVPAIIVNSEDKGVKKLTGHISLYDALEIMNKENA